MDLQFSPELEEYFDRTYALESKPKPIQQSTLNVQQMIAESFRVLDIQLEKQLREKKQKQLKAFVEPLPQPAYYCNKKLAAQIQDVLMMREKYLNFNEYILAERELAAAKEREKKPRRIKEKVVEEKLQVRQIKHIHTSYKKQQQSDSQLQQHNSKTGANRRGPYLPTVVDPFNENPKRGRNHDYVEEDQEMEPARKPRKIKKVSENLQARKVLAKIKKQNKHKSVNIQKQPDNIQNNQHCPPTETICQQSLPKPAVETPVSNIKKEVVVKDEKLKQLLSFMNDDEPGTPVAKRGQEGIYHADTREPFKRQENDSEWENTAFVSEIKQEKTKFFKQLEEKQRKEQKIAQSLKASLKQYKLKQEEALRLKRQEQKQVMQKKATEVKRQSKKQESAPQPKVAVKTKHAQKEQKESDSKKQSKFIENEDMQRRKRKRKEKDSQRPEDKANAKKQAEEEIKTQQQYKKEVERLREELKREKMKRKSGRNHSKRSSPQYESSSASSSPNSRDSSSQSSTKSWQRQLRKVTHYNPNDKQYRKRDKRPILESGFSEINREEAFSRKMGYRDEMIMLEREQKRNRRQRDY